MKNRINPWTPLRCEVPCHWLTLSVRSFRGATLFDHQLTFCTTALLSSATRQSELMIHHHVDRSLCDPKSHLTSAGSSGQVATATACYLKIPRTCAVRLSAELPCCQLNSSTYQPRPGHALSAPSLVSEPILTPPCYL